VGAEAIDFNAEELTLLYRVAQTLLGEREYGELLFTERQRELLDEIYRIAVSSPALVNTSTRAEVGIVDMLVGEIAFLLKKLLGIDPGKLIESLFDAYAHCRSRLLPFAPIQNQLFCSQLLE
jgi:hypothetical protein